MDHNMDHNMDCLGIVKGLVVALGMLANHPSWLMLPLERR